MTFYMIQWLYKDPAIKAMVESPQDRPGELKKVVAAFGGKVEHFFFTFGEYDGLAIVEFPDPPSCVACVLTLEAAGNNAKIRTTSLMTPDDGLAAMEIARNAKTGYLPPTGYSSHG